MEPARLVYLCSLLLYLEVCRELLQELLRCKAIKILHYSVVVNNLKVALREDNSHKEVVLLCAVVVRVCLGALLTNKSGGCGSVMTVCHIEGRNCGEDAGNLCNILIIVNNPEVVAKAILCNKVVLCRFGLNGLLHYCIKTCVIGISKEDRLQIGALNAHVLHSVLLLVLSGKLVLFNLAGKVVLYVGADNKSVLCAALHCLCIYIVALLGILYKPASLLPKFEVLYSLVIYRLRVLICYRVKVYLRFNYMQK